ncbi:hypothetical protein IPZ68_12305 [Streptomyces arenae]|nr:hypothetical protein [Streptomyces arenae]
MPVSAGARGSTWARNHCSSRPKPVAAPPHRGRGVGLALVDGVARRYGGSVRLTERPGGGAVFTVRLPRNPPVAAGAAP